MKRTVSFILALVTALSLITPVFAENQGQMVYTEIIAPQYEDAGGFSDGLAAVKKNGKWGFIDESGKAVIPFEYDDVMSFSEGKAVVANAEKKTDEYGGYTVWSYGFVDTQGNYTKFTYAGGTQLKFEDYNEVSSAFGDIKAFFHNGYVNLFDSDGLLHVFDKDGKAVDLGFFVTDHPYNENLFAVYSPFTDESPRYVDKDGNSVIVPVSPWDNCYVGNVDSFNQGLAPVWVFPNDGGNGVMGFINKSGEWVINPRFDYYTYSDIYGDSELFKSGIACVRENGMFGGIDKNGNTVIPFVFEYLYPESEGVMAAKQNGKWGYIGIDGKWVIEPKYEQATSFSGGYAVVYDGTNAFLIDYKGNVVEGSEKIEKDVYFSTDANGTPVIYSPASIVTIEENGKYGFGKITYTMPLPTEAEVDSWALKEVVAAIEENLVPDHLQNLYRSNITREEFASLIVETISAVSGKDIDDLVKEKTGKTVYDIMAQYPFSDSTNYDVLAANALGIVNGRGDGIFDPYATITRQEAAAFLQRAASALGMDTTVTDDGHVFADDNNVASFFKDAVKYVFGIGVMNGTGEDNFTPLGTYTRQQSFVTVYRLFEAYSK